MIAVSCQLILAMVSAVFFWKRSVFEWDTAGYALSLYFLIQILSSTLTTHRKQQQHRESLPLLENQCLYCCVPSKGKVALTRLGWLLVVQSLLVTTWVYTFFNQDAQAAFFIIILANCVGIVSYYHMMLVSQQCGLHFLYWIVLGLHVMWGLVNSRSI